MRKAYLLLRELYEAHEITLKHSTGVLCVHHGGDEINITIEEVKDFLPNFTKYIKNI